MIHVHPDFWEATNHEQVGILIMEASHWTDVADTYDFSWSAGDCLSLVVTDLAQAIDNVALYTCWEILLIWNLLYRLWKNC